MINFLQSSSVKKVSFYKITTAFAEELKQDSSLDSVQIVGHSLGGGLAIISGAQSKTMAIALSGPGARISGKSFHKPVTYDELNQYTFNIVPDRDVVARFDDLADNFQKIRCNAPANDFFACHDFVRSFCQIIYTCGTGIRPAICECHTKYGFPEPITDGNETFANACSNATK